MASLARTTPIQDPPAPYTRSAGGPGTVSEEKPSPEAAVDRCCHRATAANQHPRSHLARSITRPPESTG